MGGSDSKPLNVDARFDSAVTDCAAQLLALPNQSGFALSGSDAKLRRARDQCRAWTLTPDAWRVTAPDATTTPAHFHAAVPDGVPADQQQRQQWAHAAHTWAQYRANTTSAAAVPAAFDPIDVLDVVCGPLEHTDGTIRRAAHHQRAGGSGSGHEQQQRAFARSCYRAAIEAMLRVMSVHDRCADPLNTCFAFRRRKAPAAHSQSQWHDGPCTLLTHAVRNGSTDAAHAILDVTPNPPYWPAVAHADPPHVGTPACTVVSGALSPLWYHLTLANAAVEEGGADDGQSPQPPQQQQQQPHVDVELCRRLVSRMSMASLTEAHVTSSGVIHTSPLDFVVRQLAARPWPSIADAQSGTGGDVDAAAERCTSLCAFVRDTLLPASVPSDGSGEDLMSCALDTPAIYAAGGRAGLDRDAIDSHPGPALGSTRRHLALVVQWLQYGCDDLLRAYRNVPGIVVADPPPPHAHGYQLPAQTRDVVGPMYDRNPNPVRSARLQLLAGLLHDVDVAVERVARYRRELVPRVSASAFGDAVGGAKAPLVALVCTYVQAPRAIPRV